MIQCDYIQDDERFPDPVIFSDESTFHVSGKVNTNNCRFWSNENPRVSLEHIRDSPKAHSTLNMSSLFGACFGSTENIERDA
jgi:hypothetical protein